MNFTEADVIEVYRNRRVNCKHFNDSYSAGVSFWGKDRNGNIHDVNVYTRKSGGIFAEFDGVARQLVGTCQFDKFSSKAVKRWLDTAL